MNYQTIQQSIQSVIIETMKKIGVTDMGETHFTQPPSGEMGDISFACFEISGRSKKNPSELAREIAGAIASNEIIKEARAVGPYVNFFIKDEALFESVVLRAREEGDAVGKSDIGKGETIVLEYLSPNTNKPLHIGHVRNACLGDSLARILESQGWRVARTQIINDRGAHICKSMLMYQRHGEGRTPEGVKQDHFVGKFYEMFEREAEENNTLIEEIHEMLQKWEAGDAETRALWQKLNSWVYEGWSQTLIKIGIKVDKDRVCYESEIYMKGKEVVEKGVVKGLFYKRKDGAVEVDLSKEKLGKKVLLRADGTSIYITQDLYLADLRAAEYKDAETFIYIVGKDQEHNFEVLFTILRKLGLYQKYYHLSYGMMRLPEGKMSSRRGTVVNADDLIDETVELAKEAIKKREANLLDNEVSARSHAIGLAALKYYILHVDPKKDIVFDPKQAVSFEGDTGPYIQYTYARVQSILAKTQNHNSKLKTANIALNSEEREIVNRLSRFQSVLEAAAKEYNPAHMAHYLYELATSINSFYHVHQVLKAETGERDKRLLLLEACGVVIKKGLNLLGIEALERM